MKCFACDRLLQTPAGEMRVKEIYVADTRDAQKVYVGSECYRKIKAAGEAGYQPPKGGPRLWLCRD